MAAPKVFVSHSHKDDTFTERLVNDLRQAGADAWMDKTDLGAGDFQERISQALSGCEWFVLVLTKDALESKWVRQEVNVANILHHQGQIHDLIFIQAGTVEHPDIPAFWRVFNIFDATTDYGAARDRALKAVGLASVSVTPPAIPQHVPPKLQAYSMSPDRFPKQLAGLGFAAHIDKGIEYILPPLCRVPAGSFLMGSDPKSDKGAYGHDRRDGLSFLDLFAADHADEQPQHSVTVPAYDIGRFPVTVAEYACFVRAGKREPGNWRNQLGKLDHPVVYVRWHDAIAYALWLAECTGARWRLPTEAEWEKAARGTDGHIYPWGDTFDRTRCNTLESHIKTTTQVGMYPAGASPSGAQDMAGNVWEWTSSRFLPYPYTISGEREDEKSTGNRVQRGGSWFNDAGFATAAYRGGLGVIGPDSFTDYEGFRLVRAAPNS